MAITGILYLISVNLNTYPENHVIYFPSHRIFEWNSPFLYRIQPKIFSVLTQISKNFVGLSHASRISSVMEFVKLGFFIACHQVPMVWVLIDA